jgi:hypothetical protein
MRTRLFVLLILSLVVAACGGDKCTKEKYLEIIEDTIEKWDDARSVAANTSRMSLGPQIQSLQEIYREAEDLNIPKCAQDAHDNLLTYMEKTIDGFVAFLGQEEDSAVNRLFSLAEGYLEDWGDEVDAIGE